MRGLIRYTEPRQLFDRDRMLEGFFEDTPLWNARTPAVDVRETHEGYLMEVELPGMSEKDVEVKVEDNILTLSSHRQEASEEKKDGYLIRERRQAAFSRTFVLPNDVDREKIEAEFKNGLLRVNLAKKPEAQPKTIQVKAS